MKSIILSLFSIVSLVSAGCDNACSGHGVCDCGFCECYDNWGMGLSHDNGDCSDRICPFELAWVDTPDRLGRRHKYAECANRGICDRSTGECECFEGYEGKACARTTCPNDCSGHGNCEYIQNLGYMAVSYDFIHTEFTQDLKTFQYTDDLERFPYYGWDTQKTRACVCDPEWADVDCSKRLCPYGTDMQAVRLDQNRPFRYQTQTIDILVHNVSKLDGQSFALTFKSRLNETFTTIPIYLRTSGSQMGFADNGGTEMFHSHGDPMAVADMMREALINLPNQVIDDVNVKGQVINPLNDLIGEQIYQFNISFVGENVEGPQHILTVEDFQCLDGCFPMVSGIHNLHNDLKNNVSETKLADFNSFECGRRGKCDYASGICECFEGFTGQSCNQCTSLI